MTAQSEVAKELRDLGQLLYGDEEPTTTKEGICEYRRRERKAEKMSKDRKTVSEWQKIKKALIEFWNKEIP